ncbi:MAG: hypothetical protein CM15mP74_16170 [Halieaceae bacterium]|nr:MAG: hypothetical protein CM15mP74_16170 [Halieaceae bacterium]
MVAVNLEGEVVHNLQDQNNPFHYITGVTPCGDTLYLGSLQTVAIGALPHPEEDVVMKMPNKSLSGMVTSVPRGCAHNA